MFKILKADKDTYVTNKFIRGKRKDQSNTGAAGTLDLYKIVSNEVTGSELSRILIHFDLLPLKALYYQGKLDIANPTFFCKVQLKDVYGGQTTPSNFTVSVFPLSASFEEGIGKDITYYSDTGSANWKSSSYEISWFEEGCGQPCYSTFPGDYITGSANIPSTEVTQLFKKGNEDLIVDVTKIVSSTLTGELPDSGLRISFQKSLEDNNKTYFVKRFASSNAYDESKRPKMFSGYDDSITDDSQNLTFDRQCQITLYNRTPGGEIIDLVSGTNQTLTPVVGENCLVLKMTTENSGSDYSLFFSGSQLSYGGSSFIRGTYGSVIQIPSTDPVLNSKLKVSSSIDFTPVWCSLDGTVAYVTGSKVTVNPAKLSSSRSLKKFIVSVTNIKDTYKNDEVPLLRLNIFDNTSPLIKATRVPLELPGIVLKNVYYQVRNSVTNEVIIPFDELFRSTKVSSDSDGMFFNLDISNLPVGGSYCIDALISYNGEKQKFLNVSPSFTVEQTENPVTAEDLILGGGNIPGDLGLIYDRFTRTLYVDNLVANNLTGSLTTLSDGSPYIQSGDYISVTTGSNGSVTINAKTDIVGYVTASFIDAMNITINHSLGTRLYDIEVFDSNYNKILPKNTKANSAIQSSVEFGSPTSGYLMILGARNLG